ncbi:hypothetical protein N7478_008871 [Penicillium angulare]|uniref:uncharacterized protein n=1 Tax=Penicillium angulare TaxID=116970 RepID=UPI0025421336|nr:uncharacterized protein N7478_008871 [Penicillium angulare]KAJ5273746.1 hypothetical protein N7478_008871 [Penicillium angulare]
MDGEFNSAEWAPGTGTYVLVHLGDRQKWNRFLVEPGHKENLNVSNINPEGNRKGNADLCQAGHVPK